MLFDVDAGDPRPLYRQIVDEVRRGLAVGLLKPGESLPAVRQLAADLKVNPNTVQQAYRALAQDGIVEMRRGRGTFLVSASRAPRAGQEALAKTVAERALRDAFRHGLLASDLVAAIKAIAPKAGE